MTPPNDQIRAEMEKIGALRRSTRVVVTEAGTRRVRKHPPGGDASSHCKPFKSCDAGFMWDCVYDRVDVCDADHKGKIELRLKTHGCNNCEPTGKQPLDYSWWSQPDNGGKEPAEFDPKWKKDSSKGAITIVPSKDYKVGDKLWVKQQATCAEYKGKQETITSIFRMEIKPCTDDGEIIEGECTDDNHCAKGECCDPKTNKCGKCPDCDCDDGQECCGNSNSCGKVNCPRANKPHCCNGCCNECCRNEHCGDDEECDTSDPCNRKCVKITSDKKGKCVTIK